MNIKDAPEAFHKEFEVVTKRIIKEQRQKRRAEVGECYDDSIFDILDKNSEISKLIKEEVAKLKEKYGVA
jgi:hypothetical protein